jgi:hypothetical protein
MSLTSGMILEGVTEFMGVEYAVRIIFNNVDGTSFQCDNEMWTKGFGEKVEVTSGSGEFCEKGTKKLQLNWKDETTQYQGQYDYSAKCFFGNFTKTQGDKEGSNGSLCLFLKN